MTFKEIPSPGSAITGKAYFPGRTATPVQAQIYVHDKNRVDLSLFLTPTTEPHVKEWFARNLKITIHGGEKNKEQINEPIPNHIVFLSSEGTATFLGCTIKQHYFAISQSPCVLRSHYIVWSETNLEHIGSGLSTLSFIEGLHEWVNPNFGHPESDHQFSYKEIKYFFKAPKNIRLGKIDNFHSRICFILKPGAVGPEKTEIKKLTALLSDGEEPSSWHDCLNLTVGFNQLLILNSNRHLSIFSTFASFSNHYYKGIQTPRWAPVSNELISQKEYATKSINFSFPYNSIGPSGIRKWFDLRNKYQRAIDPLMATYSRNSTFIDNRLLTIGISIEALGYALILERTKNKNRADNANFKAYIKEIYRELDDDFKKELHWFALEFGDVYNSVKHAHRERIPGSTLASMSDVGSSLLSAWIFKRIGVPEELIFQKYKEANRFKRVKYELIPDPSQLS